VPSTATSRPDASAGTPSIASGADHGVPPPGPRSDHRFALPAWVHVAIARPNALEAIWRLCRSVPSPASISAGGVGAVQPGFDSAR